MQRTSKYIDRIPSLDEVQQLGNSSILAYTNGDELVLLLARLGMRAFYDAETQLIWFGMAAERVHDHDRWFAKVAPDELETVGNWREVGYRSPLPCGHGLQTRWIDLVDHLEDLSDTAVELISRVKPDTEQAVEQVVCNFLIAHRTFETLIVDKLQPMLVASWGKDLHDVLHHYEKWSAINNAAGMPRNIVLRMYGLGEHADTLARNPHYLRIF